MNISWKKVSFFDEREEFKRATQFFSEDSNSFNENFKVLEKMYNMSQLTRLDQQIWKKIGKH